MRLTSLADLKERVDTYASLCLPDYIYRHDTENPSLVFHPVELEGSDKEYPGLYLKNPHIENDPGETPYLFTDWSRAQLLSRLGATEKWFRDVSVQTQIEELNTRLHSLDNMKVRTLRSADEEVLPFNAVRGMVSHLYTDIPDTYIMNSLIEVIGEKGSVIKNVSGKTDRAFYAYVLTHTPVEIRGTVFQGWPGVVIRNSEVGYSSLTVMLQLFMPRWNTPVVLKKFTLLKKIHRGKINTLPELFEETIERASSLWDGLSLKLKRLETLRYVDQEEALHTLRSITDRVGATKRFTGKCVTAYKAAGHTRHDALGLFTAVLEVIRTMHEDEAFDQGVLAGALLVLLIT